MSILTIKACFKDKQETRRLKIVWDDITIHGIDKAVRKSFHIMNTEALIYAWKDTDNDYVRFTTPEELQEALDSLPQDGILRLSVASKWRQIPHPNLTCCQCQTPIRGERYICFECPRTNICSTCYLKPDNVHGQHVLLVIRNPHFKSSPQVIGNIKKLLIPENVSRRTTDSGLSSFNSWANPQHCRPGLDYSNESAVSDPSDSRSPAGCLSLPAKLLRVGKSMTSSASTTLIGSTKDVKENVKVKSALDNLTAMGYSIEDGRILTLVQQTDGDVEKVLDLLSMRRTD